MNVAKDRLELQEFITKWRTISERGADILRIAAAQRDGSFNYLEDITNVVVECTAVQLSYEVCLEVDEYHKVKAELDGMYAFLGNVLENNSVVIQYKDEDGAGRDRSSALKDHISQLQGCVHMFDQDYVMKETIQAILSSSSQTSSLQHLNGFYSVWTSQPYIDDDILKGF